MVANQKVIHKGTPEHILFEWAEKVQQNETFSQGLSLKIHKDFCIFDMKSEISNNIKLIIIAKVIGYHLLLSFYALARKLENLSLLLWS